MGGNDSKKQGERVKDQSQFVFYGR